MKKWMALFLIVIMGTVFLVGCKSEEEKNKEKAKQASEQLWDRSKDKQ
jgi:uncharacterized protein YcfL